MTRKQTICYRLAVLAIAVVAGLTLGCRHRSTTTTEMEIVQETRAKPAVKLDPIQESRANPSVRRSTTCGYRHPNHGKATQ